MEGIPPALSRSPDGPAVPPRPPVRTPERDRGPGRRRPRRRHPGGDSSNHPPPSSLTLSATATRPPPDSSTKRARHDGAATPPEITEGHSQAQRHRQHTTVDCEPQPINPEPVRDNGVDILAFRRTTTGPSRSQPQLLLVGDKLRHPGIQAWTSSSACFRLCSAMPAMDARSGKSPSSRRSGPAVSESRCASM